jgi:hypothetical protein
MTARLGSARGSRAGVLAMTPSSSRTSSFLYGNHRAFLQKIVFGEVAETSTRGTCASRKAVAKSSYLTK